MSPTRHHLLAASATAAAACAPRIARADASVIPNSIPFGQAVACTEINPKVSSLTRNAR